MEDKRQFNRWEHPTEKSSIMCEDLQGEVEVVNMSAGGMKISCSHPLEIGTVVYAQLRIVPHIRPFYIMGKVTRVMQKDNLFEVAIKFDKVSTIQITDSNKL